MIEKLAIIDFRDNSIHLYNIDSNVDMDDDYLNILGFDPNMVQTMFCSEIDIVKHAGILKGKTNK